SAVEGLFWPRQRPSRRTGECRLNLLRAQGPWGDHGSDGAESYCPRGRWRHLGGGTGGKDDDDARDVCDSLSRATAGFDLAAPRPRDRRLPTWRTASPSMRWPCVGNRRLSGTPRLGAQDPLRGSFRRGTHPAPGWREGRRGDDRVLGGAERTRRLPDPMAARGGPHHLGPGGWDGPSRAPRAVSRRAARLETTTRGAARGTQLAVVAPLPPEAHGEAGARPSRGFEAGYYEFPRNVTTEDVSLSLGIARSTFEQHLNRAEHHVIRAMLPLVRMRSGRPPGEALEVYSKFSRELGLYVQLEVLGDRVAGVRLARSAP